LFIQAFITLNVTLIPLKYCGVVFSSWKKPEDCWYDWDFPGFNKLGDDDANVLGQWSK